MKIYFTLILLLVLSVASARRMSAERARVDSLKNLIRTTEGLQKANALYELAKIYTEFSIDSTKLFIDEALAICRRLNNDTTYVLIASGMQYPLGRVGEKDLARKYLVSARNIKSPEAKKAKYQNLIYVGLYFIHYWNYTRYDSSVYYGLLTVAMAENAISKADRCILVGAAYNKMGDNIRALEYYKTAETILNELPFFSGEFCYLYNQLGTLYADEGDLRKSEQFYLQSIALGKKAGGFPQVSPLTNLAVVYDRMGKYDQALKYLDSADVLLPTAADPWRTAINIRNKGKVLTHAGKPTAGIVETLKAMKMYAQLKDNYTAARLHLQLAEPYRLLGDFKTAEREALQALEWDRTNGYGELVKESYRELARIYAATNKFGKAFEYQNHYLEILDSLNSAERRNKFVQLEKNFEFATHEKIRQHLERENELYVAQSQADRRLRIYLILGTIILTLAVIISVVAYRRTRSQNVLLNQQNRKIEEQTQQLQEAAKTKSRFFANVSHELRTPVTLITGMLELMEKDTPQNSLPKMSIALNNSRRLQTLVDEVLDLSRLEAEKVEPKKVAKEIAPLLHRIVFSFDSLFESKKIKVTYDDAQLNGVLLAIDEDKFEKIINNLLYNAVKFNHEGGSVKVTGKLDDREEHVILRVSDSGIGIPENDIAHIFDRFYQSNFGKEKNSGGIGIGLSLVKEYTELHKGRVEVVSKENEGSTFELQFPVAYNTLPLEEVTNISEEELNISFSDLEKAPVILVVEDSNEMQFYLKEIFEGDVKLVPTVNGKEALQWLSRNTPDLIISDVMMPEMDGYELMRHLKGSNNTRNIPVVLLTARGSEEDLLVGLRLGVDDYIIKPFHVQELKIRIHNLLMNQQIRRDWRVRPIEKEEETESNSGNAEFIETVEKYVREHLENTTLGIAELADHIAVSERQLYRKCGLLAGMTPAHLIKEIRLKIAYKMLIERKVKKISDLATRVGFDNSAYFSRQFVARFGRKPVDML